MRSKEEKQARLDDAQRKGSVFGLTASQFLQREGKLEWLIRCLKFEHLAEQIDDVIALTKGMDDCYFDNFIRDCKDNRRWPTDVNAEKFALSLLSCTEFIKKNPDRRFGSDFVDPKKILPECAASFRARMLNGIEAYRRNIFTG